MISGGWPSGWFGWLLALALTVSSSPYAISQTKRNQPEILSRTGQTRVPFRYENGFIVVEVRFHHVLPLRFILDTGAEYTMLSYRELSEMLGFRSERQFSLLGADMTTVIEADLIRGVDLALEGIALPARDVLVTREDYFRFHQFTGSPIHGILGADILHRFAVTIDYRRREILFQEPDRFRPPPKATALPLEIHRNKPFVQGRLILDEHRPPLSLKLLLDTGASLTLLLLADSQPELRIPAQSVEGILGLGLGGFIHGTRARVHQFDLGGCTLTSPVANFQHIGLYPDTAMLHGRHGLVGNLVLDRYRVSLDYAGKTLYLTGQRRPEKPLATDRSGMFLMATGQRFRHVLVQDVVRGSPAWDAGIRPGDILTHLNRRPVHWLGLDGLNRRFRKHGDHRFRLRVMRDGQPSDVRLTLRDYL